MAPIRARSADTDPESERIQIELLRKASPARRASIALELSAMVIGLARRALRRNLPGASPDELRLRFVELHYGKEAADLVRRHLARRDG